MKTRNNFLKTAMAAATFAACLTQGTWAASAEEIAEYIKTKTVGDLDATVAGGVVTVTGTLPATPENENFLTLNIDADVTVLWKAILQGAPNSGYELVFINGGSGTFTVETGGSIENTGTGRAIYNNSTCTVNIIGGSVSAGNTESAATIYNYSSGTINVSGGTVSTKSGTAIYNYNSNGKVNVSGGSVGATSGKAIYNEGIATISGSATKIISANSDGTILNVDGTLVINSGTVENTSAKGHAIYNALDWYGGTVTITSGTVSATGGNAIYNTYKSTTIITGGTVSTSGSGKAAVYIYGGTAKITGGRIYTTQSDGYAVYLENSTTLTLGGNPDIKDRIYIYPDKMSVITDAEDPEIFAPVNKIYTLDFPADQYAASKIAVMNGRNFLANFVLYNPEYALSTAGLHLATATAVKVSFDLNGGKGTVPADVGVLQGGKLYYKPSTSGFTKAGCTNDGEWYISSAGTTKFEFGESVVAQNMTLYLKWTVHPYTVTFNAAGGIVNPVSAMTGEGGTLASLPAPTKSGYDFVGWFAADTGGTQITTSTVFSADTAIYAKWTLSNPIKNIQKSDGRTGIRLSKNVVSDKAEFEVILPNDKVLEVKAVIYDNTGNVVFETSGRDAKLSWNLTNNAGRNVANGSYLIVVEAKGINGNYAYSAKVGVKK